MIEKGMKIEFVAKDINNNDVNLADLKGKKVISLFPKLNTRICDMQTGAVRDWSDKYKDITFVSISCDSVETTKEWCGSHGEGNSIVLSDKEYGKFGKTYKLSRCGLMKRGFIMLNESDEIVDFEINSIAKATDPNYDLVEDYLKGDKKW